MIEDWIGGIIFFGICSVVLLVVIAAVSEANDPKFELNKTEWTCTKSHSESRTSFMYSGKVMVPITSQHTICDEYRRK